MVKIRNMPLTPFMCLITVPTPSLDMTHPPNRILWLTPVHNINSDSYSASDSISDSDSGFE